nr:hypothetical protein [Tanacetum cinerariifolium]
MYVNSLYQPWRTILTMINQCLTGKTSGYDRPIHPVIQMLWGVVTGTNVDYAELIWEESVQAIKTFFSDAASFKVPFKKPKPYVIPYCQFTKLIICYLEVRNNIHKRPQSHVHIMTNDYPLRNHKFVSKGEVDEKKKAPPTGKSKQHAPAKDSKPVKEKTSKPTPSKKIRTGKVMKVRKGKRDIHMSLESFQAPVDGMAIREPDSGITQRLPVVKGKGKALLNRYKRDTPYWELFMRVFL